MSKNSIIQRILNALADTNPVNFRRQTKSALVTILDACLVPISLWLAFVLRLGIADPTAHFPGLPIVIIMVVSLGALFFFRLDRIKLHSFDVFAISKIARASFGFMLISATVDFFAASGIPRSIPVLFGALYFVLAITIRIIVLWALRWISSLEGKKIPVAIYGAGAAGVQLASALQHSAEVKPIFFVDENPNLVGLVISGLKVRSLDKLRKLARLGRIQRILIAIPSLSGSERTQLLERLADLPCEIQIVPSYVDLISGRSVVSDLRPVSADELLGRDAVVLDTPEMRQTYTGKNVMVTGAGGSIGSELCRQLLQCGPRKIVLFERSEHALYEIDQDISVLAQNNGTQIVCCLGSVTDRDGVEHAIRHHEVDVLLHAAAYKHVPLVEANEVEGARNNIIGTYEVAEAARAAKVGQFISISTDKAVRPTNVMGATKRVAELILHDIQTRSEHTKFSMVRFGNVLGSSGSVVPRFTDQISKGGPITVTHPEITRYFMTIPEAARLVLLAGAHSRGDDLFVLDMGEPVKIVDLAYKMVKLANRTIRDENNPDGDIEIKFTGLRPGEKLYEELLIQDVSRKDAPHEKILRASEGNLSQIEIASMIRAFRKAVDNRDSAMVRELIGRYVEQPEKVVSIAKHKK